METQETVRLLLALFGGLGVGSIMTTILKERFDRKKFLFDQKEQIYSGYLKSLSDVVAAKSSTQSRQEVVYWTMRMKLLAPTNIVKTAEMFYRTSLSSDFIVLREEIIDLMRKDLDNTL